MRLRSLIAGPVRWLFAEAGYDLVNLNAFGHDPFRDIRILNEKWNSSVRTFFDVGANDGDTSLKALKQFPQAQIFAFEPHPDTFLSLKDATKDHSAIDPVQTALGAPSLTALSQTHRIPFASTSIRLRSV